MLDGRVSGEQRRIVTGHVGGRSVVLDDNRFPTYDFQTRPGFAQAFLWATPGGPFKEQERAGPDIPASILPDERGTTLQVVTFPPASATGLNVHDDGKASRELAERLPGLAATFEHDHPGMHTTPTVDYAIVLSGDISLELDDGALVDVSAGDIVIQQATRHGWRNRSLNQAILAFVMVGLGR